jgi:hypothetical protein
MENLGMVRNPYGKLELRELNNNKALGRVMPIMDFNLSANITLFDVTNTPDIYKDQRRYLRKELFRNPYFMTNMYYCCIFLMEPQIEYFGEKPDIISGYRNRFLDSSVGGTGIKGHYNEHIWGGAIDYRFKNIAAIEVHKAIREFKVPNLRYWYRLIEYRGSNSLHISIPKGYNPHPKVKGLHPIREAICRYDDREYLQ